MSDWEASIEHGRVSDRLRAEWEALGRWEGRSTHARLFCARRHRLAEVWSSSLGLALAVPACNRYRMRWSHLDSLSEEEQAGRKTWEIMRVVNDPGGIDKTFPVLVRLSDLVKEGSAGPAVEFACACRAWEAATVNNVVSQLERRYSGVTSLRPRKVPSAIVDADGTLNWRSR